MSFQLIRANGKHVNLYLSHVGEFTARDAMQDTDKEWESWDTEPLTVTVVPDSNITDPVDPRLKYSTKLSSTAENDPSAEELFHDMQPVFKKPKKV